jgi:hypothetical protein
MGIDLDFSAQDSDGRIALMSHLQECPNIYDTSAIGHEGTLLLEYIQQNVEDIDLRDNLIPYGRKFEDVRKRIKESLADGKFTLTGNDDTPIYAVKELGLTENMYLNKYTVVHTTSTGI